MVQLLIMNQSAKSWLLWMMVPLFIGVLIYFIVPLQIIINSNPRLEQNFNGYRIEVEQNTVRAISFLNSRIVTMRMQMYRNLLSSYKRLFVREQIKQVINLNNIKINSAYQLANMNETQTFKVKSSMWYSPNVTTQSNMTETQKQIFNAYKQAQPYLQSILACNNSLFRPIFSSQTMFSYQNDQFYFAFPSQKNQTFNQTDKSVLNYMYVNTIDNYKNKQINITLFDIGTIIQLCTVAFFKSDTQNPNGVTCFNLGIQILLKNMAQQTTDLDISVNDYYYVRPLYEFENFTNPQIVANFSSMNPEIISIPIREFFSLQESNLSRNLMLGERYYFMNIQRLQQTNTYYTIPISSFNSKNEIQILLYLIVLNNFARAQFSEESRNQRIATIMVVPSVVILLLCIIITTFVLKSIFQKLDEALRMMENYCSLIQRGDLQLEIAEYNEGEDLKVLFQQLSRLNQLNKYSDFLYLNVPKPERIFRLLKCMKLFQSLGYNLTNIYESISECYVEIGEMSKGLHFLRMSINNSIKQIYKNPQQIDKIYLMKLQKNCKIDKQVRKKQKNLCRKILRMCQLLNFPQIQKQDIQKAEQEMLILAELLRKIIFPDVLSYEHIGCYMFIVKCQIKKGPSQAVNSKLDSLYELIIGYQQLNRHNKNREASTDIIMSYYNSIKVSLALQQKNYLQAFDLCVKTLEGNQFNPIVHHGINSILQHILEVNQIKKQELNEFKYREQYRHRGKRQYVFLIDVSKPEMSKQDVNVWKKKARAMAEFILNKQVEDNDRVSITQFCLDIKIICNLVEKNNREKILHKQLMSSIKARDQNIIASVIPCLRKSVERIKHLKNQKIFILFLKEGLQLNSNEILQQFEEVENVKTLLFIQSRNMIGQKNQQVMVLDYKDFKDVSRILGPKTIKPADNIVYIF